MEFKYFKSVKGKGVVLRYGSGVWIGATKAKGGFVMDTKTINAIPVTEYTRYLKEYTRALKTGALVEASEVEQAKHQKQFKASEAEGKKVIAKAKKQETEKTQKGSAPNKAKKGG